MKVMQSLICLMAGCFATASVFAMTPPTGHVPDHYIVTLKAGVNPASMANEMALQHGLGLRHVYRHALSGFAARVPAGRLKALAKDARVLAVHPDEFVSLDKRKCNTPPCGGGGDEPPVPPASQIIPTGVERINGDLSSALAGNGSGAVNVDVAVIDTGIMTGHSDLNVVGGINCSKGRASKYSDGNGHGTHVAGTIAAKDNNQGVVGVAPGARLWAVRVLNNAGSGFTSDIICGIDWVTEHAATIEVANMSLGGSGSDSGGCSGHPQHQAICNSVAAGVTYVVAAGNESDDSAKHVPAAYDEVITVSALADFDGESGGEANATCRNDSDDTFANFSNYGADVDIIAPGVCIESTWNDGGLNTISGTSMAAPHVAGAAALYKSVDWSASPAVVKAALIGSGSNAWNSDDDPDGLKEPLLDVGGL